MLSSEADCKVYFTTEAHLAEFKFNNPPSVFDEAKVEETRAIFSEIYGFRCNIDQIRSTTDENGNALLGKTTLETHFIDEVNSEPVPAVLIVE